MLLVPVALALAGVAVLGSFTRFFADDFAKAMLRGPFWRTMADIYAAGSDRYSAAVLWYLLVPRGILIARLLPSVIILLWLLALFWLARELAPQTGPRWSGLACAAVVLFAVLESTPSIGQALYWETQSLTYTAPLLALTALLAWCVRVVRHRRAHVATIIGIALLAFVAAGFCETTTAVEVALAIAAFVLAAWIDLLKPRAIVLVLAAACVAGALAGLAVMASAPATAMRQAEIGYAPSLSYAITRSVPFAALFVARAFALRPLATLMPFAIALLAGAHSRPMPPLAGRSTKLRVASIALASFALIVICFVPAAYVLLGPPGSRALIVPQYVLVLFMFTAGWSLAHVEVVRARLRGATVRRVLTAFLVVVPLLSLISTAARVSDAAQYARAWDLRDAQLRRAAARGLRDVIIEPLPEHLSLVRAVELPGNDVTWWINRSMADYYGLRTVRVAGTPGPMVPEVWQEGWQGRLYQKFKVWLGARPGQSRAP